MSSNSNPFAGLSREERLGLYMALIFGDSAAAKEKISNLALEEIERNLVGAVRRHRSGQPDGGPLNFGPEARAYIEKAIEHGPKSSEGLILALTEMVLQRDQNVRDLMDRAPVRRSDLDFAALEAERDDLKTRLGRAERDRDREGRAALDLERALRESNRDLADTSARLNATTDALIKVRAEREQMDARIKEQENTILRMDIELTGGRPATAPLPTCESCGTAIGWTRKIEGHADCEGCALKTAKENQES